MPYHTQSSGVDVPAFQRALQSALALASAGGHDLIYLTPNLDTLESDAAVAVLGAGPVGALKKNRVASWNGVKVHLETARQKRTGAKSIVFAPYASLDLLAKREGDHRTADFVFVPWSDVELAQYEARHPQSQVI